ncbi:hypothetical protein E6O75_ATG04920 [Venturia nashicola]|uniref:Uncharacterized protein n=1 Tax=Venturia nashicola TaxID=86259 RepID=A0A4Z1PF36_9PEZI|nr:hypothetical protein E6O75_ATG04920 [Venturia nashicola]
MATNVDDLADWASGLAITSNASSSPHSTVVSLWNNIETLVRPTNAVTFEIGSLQSDSSFPGNLPTNDIGPLNDRMKRLRDISERLQSHVRFLKETTESSMVTHLISLGYQGLLGNQSGSTLPKMLSHFDVQMKEIVRDVLDHTDNNRDLLLRVAEECYNQVTRPSGKLDAENYFIPLGEAALGWPYDEDFESELYYEHESRLEVDEGYAAAHRQQSERRYEAEKMKKQSWPRFWVTVLNNVPGGPTLFYPPASNHVHARDFDTEVPQYLFRTFDEDSSGRNSDSEITSMASISLPETSRTDIFALKSPSAISLLFGHLDKPCFSGDKADKADNLMSWTSSFLFAIQGQYARDICLLKTYQANAKQLQDKAAGEFFTFRLTDEDYYNGEFLSQGKVSLVDRACVVSLEDLIQAGLFELYPEFDDVEGGKKWAKRALELRRSWSAERTTSDHEIKLALGIGSKCFSRFGPLHVAHILLAFKSRKYTENFQSVDRSIGRRPQWADKPDEVRRYWISMKAGKADIDSPGSMALADGMLLQKKLREMFH